MSVKALVYIAAYAPDQGDTVLSLSQLGTEGQIGPATLDITPFPNPDGTTGQEVAMAKRIKPKKTITVKGASHVVMISQPKTTSDFILEAAKTVK